MTSTAKFLESFYKNIFSNIEEMINKHESYGSWSIGKVPCLNSISGKEFLGFWYAEAKIPGFESPGAISIALVPGHSRFGIFLPLANSIDYHGKENDFSLLQKNIAKSFDGKEPNIFHIDREKMLIDRFFEDAPFDNETFVKAMSGDEYRFHALVQRSAYIIITLWESAIRILCNQSNIAAESFVIISEKQIFPQDLLGIPSAVLIEKGTVNGKYMIHIKAKSTEREIYESLKEKFSDSIISIEKM